MARSPHVIIIDPDHGRREELRKSLALSGVAVLGVADYGAEARSLCMETTPDVILIAIGEPLPRALHTIEAIAEMMPGIPMLAYSTLRSPEIMRQVMNLGVRDFLHYPIDREGLVRSIRSLMELEERRRAVAGQEYTPFGSVVTVFGPKGGVGKSTLATNLAVALRRYAQCTVALVDLDVRFGDVAVMLGLPVERSIVDLAQNGYEVSLDQVRQCMVRHASGLDVLPAPHWRGEWYPLTPDHVGSILHILARGYDFVVVDTAAGFNDLVSRALEVATLALLITTPDVTGLKEALAVLEMLRAWSYPEDKIELVLNHVVPQTKASDEEVRRVLGMAPSWRIPFDQAVVRCLREGQPLVTHKPRSPAAVSIVNIAMHLVGRPLRRNGLIGRLLRRPAAVGRR